MKSLLFLISIIVISYLPANAKTEKLPQFEIDTTSPLNAFLSYVVFQCDSLNINPELYPISIAILKEDEDDMTYVSISMPTEPKLFWDSYIGYIEVSGQKFFIDEASKHLLSECCTELRQLDNYTTIEIEDYPVIDGIEQSWLFAIKDGTSYIVRYQYQGWKR